MKILLIAVGTRGDVEPFLAIAELLTENGHEIICCFPEQFKNLAEEGKLNFVGLTPKFLEMIDSVDGKMAMGGKGSIFKKIVAYYNLYKKSVSVNKVIVAQQHDLIRDEKPDRIIYHIKSIYPLIHEVQYPRKTILVSPIPYLIHAVDEHSHMGFIYDFGKFLNRLTYSLANFGLIKNVQSASKALQTSIKINSRKLKTALLSSKMIFTISPSIIPRPNYWPDNVQILGYHERNKMVNWKPNKQLLDFVSKHNKVLFITFGSMTNPEPEKQTKIFINILEKHKIPAIINTASGGLVEPSRYNVGLIHFVKRIPYDWIFPKIYGVIHHGGSGTTHMALKYGCVSMIVPHIVDQYLWNDSLSKLGVGPKGMAVNKLSNSNQKLETSILDLLQMKSYKTKAEEISIDMQNENLKNSLLQMLTKR